jgi:DNA (cytosine-5)-methyltransferase 1
VLPQTIDVIYGGFPCQDISTAGDGVGLEGKRSGLFFEIMRLAEEVGPTFIFLENVPAIRTRGLDQVGKELANRGYDCRWCSLSAQEIGAPHIRKRWFCLAYSMRKRLEARVLTNGEETNGQAEGRGKENRRDASNVGFCKWSDTSEPIRVADGLPHRVDRIRGLGNAVVPEQAREAFKHLIGLQ